MAETIASGISGTLDNDSRFGTPRDDTINAKASDTIIVIGSNDTVYAESGDDVVLG